MPDFSFEVNADKLAAALSAVAGATRERLAAALFEEAEQIMTRAKAEFVPVDTGVLRASGYVEPPVWSGDEVTVTLGFGGPAAAYALVQHEDLSLHHPALNRPGGFAGQAKYLERPMLEAMTDLPQRLAEKISEG